MDLELDRKELFLASVILLLIIAWTLGSFSSALFGIEEVRHVPEFEQNGEEDTSPSFQFDFPEWLRYAPLVFVILGLSLGIATDYDTLIIIKRFSVCALLILVIFHLDYLLQAFEIFIGLFSGLSINLDLPSFPDIIFRDGDPTSGRIGSGLFGLLVVGISVSFLVVMLLKKKRDEIEKEDEKDLKMSSVTKNAITELHKGKDVRDVIIRHYQKMCLLFKKRGIDLKMSLTPREFENKALENLSLKEDTIRNMTILFERAKYSDHQLKEDDRKKAIKNFKQIKNELGDEYFD